MGKKEIKVYTKFGKIENCYNYFAIITNDVIKYIDLDKNKMIVDINKYVIIRENKDYIFTMRFQDNVIDIFAKHINRNYSKEINTLFLEKNNKRCIIRYLLSDENIVNEYSIYF